MAENSNKDRRGLPTEQLIALLAALGAAVIGVLGVAGLSGAERSFTGLAVTMILLGCLVIGVRGFAGQARAIFVSFIGLALVGGIAVAWSGWSQHGERNDKSSITRTIQGAADVEASWYQHPRSDRLQELERYYVVGGPGISTIVGAARHFRQEHCRWAKDAHHLIDVRSVDLSGKSATVHSVETYHQPRLCSGPPPPTSAKVDAAWKNTYQLEKTGHGWRIISSSVIYLR
jgi:hypothetical protein